MAVGSGIGASVGVAPETTYGTYVPPTRFLEVDNSQLKKVKNTNQSDGLAAGRMVELGSQRVVTTVAAAGNVNMTVLSKGFGLLIQHIMGGSAAPVQQGATAAYLQTHILADNIGKSLTIQNGIPDTSGTVRPYSFLGCKILSAEFSCGIDDILKVTLEVDARDVTEAQSLAAPSYVTAQVPFHFGTMALKLGAFGSEAVVQGVRSVKIKLARPQKTDRFYAGNAGLKSEPIMNDRFAITGSIDVDYVTKGDFADRFAADANTSLVWEFVGPTAIAGSNFPTFRVRVPMTFLDGDGQTLDGPDVQMQSYPIVGKNDGTNPPATIEYMSTDTTV